MRFDGDKPLMVIAEECTARCARLTWGWQHSIDVLFERLMHYERT
jgi:hypothetical protein